MDPIIADILAVPSTIQRRGTIHTIIADIAHAEHPVILNSIIFIFWLEDTDILVGIYIYFG